MTSKKRSSVSSKSGSHTKPKPQSKSKSKDEKSRRPKRKRDGGEDGFATKGRVKKDTTLALKPFVNKWHNCKACPLHKTRDQIVLYDGKCPADVLFIGEAPGHSEDAIGTPFIGASGQLLRQMLTECKRRLYRMPSWSITNAVCCCPMDRERALRPPSLDEIIACSPRLLEFISQIRPRMIFLVGNQAEKAWKNITRNKDNATTLLRAVGPEAIIVKIKHPAWIMRQGASPNNTFQENYDSCLDFKRAFRQIRDALKTVTLS